LVITLFPVSSPDGAKLEKKKFLPN